MRGDWGRRDLWQVGPELGGWWEIRGCLKRLCEMGPGPVVPPPEASFLPLGPLEVVELGG